jgi:hypothetical protein
MARRRYDFDEDKIARFLKEGRGAGCGVSYKPWLTIQDVPANSRCHRVRSLTTGRMHHLLSDIEYRLFLMLDWADTVEDIREQFPLDRAITRRIAEEMGVRHPADVVTKVPLVMTTDMVVDMVTDWRLLTFARAVKPADQLDKPRVLEKLEIERRYWAERQVDWAIVTEKEIPKAVAANIAWVHGYGWLDDLAEPHPGYYQQKAALIRRELPLRPATMTLQRFCADMDARLQMEPGVTLFLVRHLIARKAIACDMSEPFDDSMPLSRLLAEPADRARVSR